MQGEDFIAFDRDLSIRKEIDRYLRQRSVDIRIVMEFDNIETIKQAVEIGAGISILPEPPIRDVCRSGSLAAVRLIAPELRRPIGIIHRQRKVFTPTATKFVELLKEVQSQSARGSMNRARRISRHLPARRQAGLRAVGHASARGGHGGRPGAGCPVRRRRHLRQVPRRGQRGRGAATPEEQRLLAAEELHAGCRLACQTSVDGPMSVLVPSTSLVNRPYQILSNRCTRSPAEGPPVISKHYLELPPPDRGDDAPDLDAAGARPRAGSKPSLSMLARVAAAVASGRIPRHGRAGPSGG